jgi:hypothetical protein
MESDENDLDMAAFEFNKEIPIMVNKKIKKVATKMMKLKNKNKNIKPTPIVKMTLKQAALTQKT